MGAAAYNALLIAALCSTLMLTASAIGWILHLPQQDEV